MPTGSLPLPQDLVQSVGDFKTALKDVQAEIRAIDRESKKLLNKGLVDYGGAQRRAELMLRADSLQESLTEQDRQKAFDKRMEKWARRKASAERMDTRDVADVRDIIDLARGDINVRNISGAAGLVSKLKQTGLKKGIGGLVSAAPGALSRMLGFGELGMTMAPVAWAYLAYDQLQKVFDEANAVASTQEKGRKNIAAAFKDERFRAEIRRSLNRAAGQENRDAGFDEWVKLSEAKYVELSEMAKEVTADPANAAAILRHNFGMSVAPTQQAVESAMTQLAGEGYLDEMLSLSVGRRRALVGQAKAQREAFEADPGAAARFHNQARVAARLERERAAEGVRGW